MGGFAFPTRAASPPPAQTVWLGFLADRYTMLSPYLDAGANANFISTPTSYPACKLTNQFNLINASFGAFATAPDGTTNTMQKIVEDGTTNLHLIQAGFEGFDGTWPILRVIGAFKAAERTRIAFQIIQNAVNGMHCGFDLAGGQIAYGANFIGTGASLYSLVGQAIYALGGGVYVCYADILPINLLGIGLTHGLSFRFLLDNGSGTAAPSLNYAGTGTSGLFGWRHSVLPKQAWNINNVTFNEDFNDPTMANIDLNNTKNPNKKWFVQQNWFPGWFTSGTVPPPPAPGSLSVTGSILKIPSQATPAGGGVPGGISSFSNSDTAKIGPYIGTPGVGMGWRMPVVFEASMAYGYAAAWQNGDFSFWAAHCEWADSIAAGTVSGNGAISGAEYDFAETQGLFPIIYGPINTGFFYSPVIGSLGNASNISTGPVNAWTGYALFQPSFLSPNSSTYAQLGTTVASGGLFYYSINSGAITAGPPSSGWASYTYPSAANAAPHDPAAATDFTQQHIWTTMLFPYTPGDVGCRLCFFDGAFRGGGQCWTPSIGAAAPGNFNTLQHTGDHQRIFVMFNQNALGATIGSGYDMFVDYFRVMQ